MRLRIFFEGKCPDEFQTPNRVHREIVDCDLSGSFTDDELVTELYRKGFTGLKHITIFENLQPSTYGLKFASTRQIVISFPAVRKFVQPYSNQYR